MAEQRVAVVTGAGRGIGRAIAERLAADGFCVAVNDIGGDEAAACVAGIEASGGRALLAPADVSDRDAVHAMVAAVVEHYGRLDVMVSNAGIVQVDPVMNITEQDFDRLFAINVKGVIWCAQAAAAQMIAQGEGGKIINAASIAAFGGDAMVGTYCASKFSVRALTQSMAQEFAPHGITVNAYCPGIVDTDMWQIVDERGAELTGEPPGSFTADRAAKIPLGRLQTPEDVANFVSFLAGPGADYITGQSMMTNGGIRMV
jgi:meso-butanediol dehydrogenase/(S,S)-butanediol dehydrogenase/diacetyl reductase